MGLKVNLLKKYCRENGLQIPDFSTYESLREYLKSKGLDPDGYLKKHENNRSKK